MVKYICKSAFIRLDGEARYVIADKDNLDKSEILTGDELIYQMINGDKLIENIWINRYNGRDYISVANNTANSFKYKCLSTGIIQGRDIALIKGEDGKAYFVDKNKLIDSVYLGGLVVENLVYTAIGYMTVEETELIYGLLKLLLNNLNNNSSIMNDECFENIREYIKKVSDGDIKALRWINIATSYNIKILNTPNIVEISIMSNDNPNRYIKYTFNKSKQTKGNIDEVYSTLV